MDPSKLLHAEISASIIAAFYEVYNNLGYGFLVFPYDAAMERELLDRQHQVGREVGVPLYYKAYRLCTYRLDMLVDDKVIIEIKSTAELPKTAIRQLHTYLYATDYEVGLLLHFGPEPKFYRQCVLNKDKKRGSVPDQKNPVDRFIGPQEQLGEAS